MNDRILNNPECSQSKHATLAQCWRNAGPASRTMSQHWGSIEWASHRQHAACWASLWSGRHSLVLTFWQISLNCLAGSFVVVLFLNSGSFLNVTHSQQTWCINGNAGAAGAMLFQTSFNAIYKHAHSGLQVSKKQNVSSLLTRNSTIFRGASVIEK